MPAGRAPWAAEQALKFAGLRPWLQGQAIPGSLLIPPQISNGLSVGVNLLILLGITLVTRALAFLAIYGAARFKYL